jgi:hypothetical protein
MFSGPIVHPPNAFGRLTRTAEERNALQLIKQCLKAMDYPDDRVERVAPGRYDVADFGHLNIGILRNVCVCVCVCMCL